MAEAGPPPGAVAPPRAHTTTVDAAIQAYREAFLLMIIPLCRSTPATLTMAAVHQHHQRAWRELRRLLDKQRLSNVLHAPVMVAAPASSAWLFSARIVHAVNKHTQRRAIHWRRLPIHHNALGSVQQALKEADLPDDAWFVDKAADYLVALLAACVPCGPKEACKRIAEASFLHAVLSSVLPPSLVKKCLPVEVLLEHAATGPGEVASETKEPEPFAVTHDTMLRFLRKWHLPEHFLCVFPTFGHLHDARDVIRAVQLPLRQTLLFLLDRHYPPAWEGHADNLQGAIREYHTQATLWHVCLASGGNCATFKARTCREWEGLYSLP
ncbi:unnamed protein product [Symbiodinium sp. KB8]|nr:unnamed protein product [Symbiodinium sp. KB8]